MSQDSVLKYINKHPKGVTAKQIKNDLGLSMSSVANSLKKLREYHEVKVDRRSEYDFFEGFIYYPKDF